MGKLIYLLNTSLDGFVADRDGKFDWTPSNEEVHRFHGDQLRSVSAVLYGRRIYELMQFWDRLDLEPSVPEYIQDFTQVWREKPKIVFSTTLKSVGPNARLAGTDLAAELAQLRKQSDGDLAVAGPTLAASFARLGLIDEFRLVVLPIIVGGGKSYFPPVDRALPLRLLETRTFESGAVYLRYERVG